jgi:hypothetical protein
VRSVAGVLAAAIVLAACGAGDGASAIGRDGSAEVTTSEAIAVGAPLASYSVTYRIEELHDDDVLTSTGVLTVDRPFRSRLRIIRDGEVQTLRVADLVYLASQTGDGDATATTPPPLVAPGDVRAVAVDLAQAPGDDVDECIDAAGLVLEEVVRDGDTITRRWVAESVDEAPRIDDGLFALPDATTIAPAQGGGSAQAVDPSTAPPGTFWQLDRDPAGFSHQARYAVVPPQAASADDPKTRDEVIAGVVDVYRRGIDVIVIDQGGTLGKVPPFGTRSGSETVDLGELARVAEWYPTPTGAEVRALLPPGRYVTLTGTVPADDLIALARALRPVEGTGLRYL